MRESLRLSSALLLALLGCSEPRSDDVGPGVGGSAGDGSDDGGDEGPGSDDGSDDGGDGGGAKFDTPAGDDDGACPEGHDCGDCEAATHTPCDSGTDDPFAALGLNCPGELEVDASKSGHPRAIGVLTSFGQTSRWAPREGDTMAVIGSGFVDELGMETPDDDTDSCPTYCSNDVSHDTIEGCSDESQLELGEHDPGNALPAPIDVDGVGGDCFGDPALVGTGDCSNTVQGQFYQGKVAHDYAELRLTATVPENVTSFSYDFAFFSTEYPVYYGWEYNDMYIAWLDSDWWTGNISFDGQGNPISLNAAFLDFRDDDDSLPELAGTCMRGHAGTRWLSTTAPVKPADEITVVLAIFDLSDPILDSYALIDNWQWGCEDTPGPDTKPVG